MAKKVFLLVLLFILALSSVHSEIIVHKIYPQKQTPFSKIYVGLLEKPEKIYQCNSFNITLLLKNIGNSLESYLIKISDGLSEETSLTLMPQQEEKLTLKLTPECSFYGKLTPSIVVETDDERAELPFSIFVEKTEDKCNFYFNESVCSSENYIRVNKEAYIDLSSWFRDPDNDKLTYSVVSNHVKVKIKNHIARILPEPGWKGGEVIKIIARDPKNGYAEARFYIHVITPRTTLWSRILGFFRGLIGKSE